MERADALRNRPGTPDSRDETADGIESVSAHINVLQSLADSLVPRKNLAAFADELNNFHRKKRCVTFQHSVHLNELPSPRVFPKPLFSQNFFDYLSQFQKWYVGIFEEQL